MELRDKVVAITGAARGIGAAMARAFAAEGAAGLVLSDVDGDVLAETVAGFPDGRAIAIRADVSDPEQVADLVAGAERAFGPVDLFCSNAGVTAAAGLEASAEDWARCWAVNLMAHSHAAKAVLPSMLERGRGYLLNTVSAAGLLSSPGDAPYTATKHAALGLAEWLSLTYGNLGIKVSALCPQGVRTDMLMPGIESGHLAAAAVTASGELLEPDQVAAAVVAGLAEEHFLILPHPEVAKRYARKAADPDRWLAGMARSFGLPATEPATESSAG